MARVVVLGGGVVGLATAAACLAKGHRVTVVDRNDSLRDGCSFGNAGMVVPSHFVPLAAPGMVALGLKWMWNPESPFYIQPRLDFSLLTWGFRFWRAATAEHVKRCGPLLRDLSWASRAAFEEMSTVPGQDFGLVRKGLVMLCQTSHALEEEAQAAMRARELGIPAEVLGAREIATLDPGVTLAVQGGVYYPKDCHLSPHRFMAMLQRRMEEGQVEFLWNTEMRGWREEGRRLRAAKVSGVAGSGDLEADEFVLCGGSWSPEMVKELGLHIPMQAGKGYSVTVSQPRQLPEICSILTEARVAVTPMDGKLRFGGTMEIADKEERINSVRVRGIIKAALRYFPEFRMSDFEGIKPWVGLRPCSPDGMPYIGRTAEFANLTFATGHAMMGLSLAPVTGQIVAQILSGEKPAFDMEPLAPDRFG